MEKIKKLVLPLVVINLLVLDAVIAYFGLTKQSVLPVSAISQPPQAIYQDQCGADCQKYITEQMQQIKLPTPEPTTKVVGSIAPTIVKTTSVNYVPVPGVGSANANDWVDLPGTDFYFNLSDYPGLQSIYFETNIHLKNGNGQAFVRLFDVTHGIGVQGSEASTISQTSAPIESGQVSFWQGKNLIRVQAKSLTADTAVFDSGSLKITTKN